MIRMRMDFLKNVIRTAGVLILVGILLVACSDSKERQTTDAIVGTTTKVIETGITTAEVQGVMENEEKRTLKAEEKSVLHTEGATATETSTAEFPASEIRTTDEEEEYEGLLPIGSVVLLANSTKRVMILGVCQMEKTEAGDTLWDYSGCLYPEGHNGGAQTYLFNGDHIEEVFSLGFRDFEQQTFKQDVDELLKKLRGESSDTMHYIVPGNSVNEDSILDNYEGLLPNGSVVLLADSTKRIMIMGVCQKQSKEEGDVIWDYSGCLYPEGHIGGDQTYLFNGAQIEEVFSLGYQDYEQQIFKKKADDFLKEIREKSE